MVLELIGIAITFAAVAVGAWFLGGFMVTVFTGGRTFLHPVLRPVEVGFYRLSGIKEDQEQGWILYTVTMLAVQVVSFVFTYVILRLQDHLPLNPTGFTGEQTMSYLSQMLGLVIHNFLSAATGLALAVALIRAFSARKLKTLGNFYVDVTRSILYVLLPISIIAPFILVSQGVVQTLSGYPQAHTLQGATQSIAVGPFASQEAIKDLGNNGGGPVNANSAHPFENPNGLVN